MKLSKSLSHTLHSEVLKATSKIGLSLALCSSTLSADPVQRNNDWLMFFLGNGGRVQEEASDDSNSNPEVSP